VALWVCLGDDAMKGAMCGTQYAVGLSRCPRCSSTDMAEVGSEKHMAKISKHGGPTHADAEQGNEPESATSGGEVGEQPQDGAAGNATSTATVSVDGTDQGTPNGGQVPDGRPFKPLPEAVDGEQGEVVSEPDYDAWGYGELQAECKTRELPATGRAPELAARLRAHDAAKAKETAEDGSPADEDGGADTDAEARTKDADENAREAEKP
jgi:hypothetical protein